MRVSVYSALCALLPCICPCLCLFTVLHPKPAQRRHIWRRPGSVSHRRGHTAAGPAARPRRRALGPFIRVGPSRSESRSTPGTQRGPAVVECVPTAQRCKFSPASGPRYTRLPPVLGTLPCLRSPVYSPASTSQLYRRSPASVPHSRRECPRAPHRHCKCRRRSLPQSLPGLSPARLSHPGDEGGPAAAARHVDHVDHRLRQ